MGGVVKTIIPQAPVGAVTHWGDTRYEFRELTRQTFDPGQPPWPVPVVVDPDLGVRSYTTGAGETFHRDRAKIVSAQRYDELDELRWNGAQVLVEKGG